MIAREREIAELVLLATIDPAQFWERMSRAVGLVRAKILFRDCIRGERVHVSGRVLLSSRGRVSIGDRVQFLPGMIPTRLVVHPGGDLTIGSDTGINYGVSIEARTRVTIGERCMFGTMSRVADANSAGNAPVTIGDDVWLAHGAVVEPGVTIGAGSVITAGSVVCKDVPPGSIALGRPATSVPLPGRSQFLRTQSQPVGRPRSDRPGPNP